jgi:hypothetical protein
MMRVMPGDFCCKPIAGGLGQAIRLGQWANGDGFTDYDHTEIYCGDADAVAPWGYTFSAYPGGAHHVALPCPPETLPGALWSSGHIDLTARQRVAALEWCLRLKGTPYSFLDYDALAAHRLHLPVPGLKTYIKSSGHQMCSQITDFIYMKAGVHFFHGIWQGYVVPAMLSNLILDDGRGITVDLR